MKLSEMFNNKGKMILGLIAVFSICVTLLSLTYVIFNYAALGTQTSLVITTFLLITAAIMALALSIGFRTIKSKI